MIKLKLFLILAYGIFAVIADNGWVYSDSTENEDLLKWGGLCDNGTRQSPIDLSSRDSVKGIFDDLEFLNYETKQSGVSIINNGHTIKVTDFAKTMELEDGPLRDKYVVEQIHLHWWSEHTIDHVRFPMEAHIVHRNTRYPTVSEALKAKDGLAVVGVLYHFSKEPNSGIETILENLDEIKDAEHTNKPIKMKNAFVARNLFGSFDSYFTYAGSLTTPFCAESVTWIVLGNSFPITLQQVNQFREIEYKKGRRLENNYRSIQKTNKRAVIMVSHGNSASENTATHAMQMSTFGIIVLALFARWLH